MGTRISASNPDRQTPAHDLDVSGWQRVTLEVRHTTGEIVDVALLRPPEWIEQYGIRPGQAVDLRMTELQTRGRAFVVSIDDAVDVDHGPGSVVTGTFVTRNASNLVRITFDDGTSLTGTDNHPVWAPEDGDWKRLGDFQPGELVQGRERLVVVEFVERLDERQPVYNIEVSSENVYEVTSLGILVHNSGINCDKWFDLQRKRLRGEAFSPDELKTYNELRDKIVNFEKYMDPEDVRKLNEMRPDADGRWHRHHILEKLGLSDSYRETLLDAQEILWKEYGINPFTSLEMFVWARMGKEGLHGSNPALEVANQILDAARRGASKDDMLQLLDRLRKAAGRL